MKILIPVEVPEGCNHLSMNIKALEIGNIFIKFKYIIKYGKSKFKK